MITLTSRISENDPRYAFIQIRTETGCKWEVWWSVWEDRGIVTKVGSSAEGVLQYYDNKIKGDIS